MWLDGEEVHLTPIEFSLLRVLALNRGLLLTHRQLLIEVWGPEYADATPLLRTHIANLRGKLAAARAGRRRSSAPTPASATASALSRRSIWRPEPAPAARWRRDLCEIDTPGAAS